MISSVHRAAAAAFLIAVLQLVPGCGPDRAKEHYQAATGLLGSGDYVGAVAEYSTVVAAYQSSPLAPVSQYRIAEIYNRHLSDRKRAMDAYSTLLYLFPDSPEARKAREDVAGIYSSSGEHLKAIEAYERLGEDYPGDASRLRYLVAMEYFRLNDFRQSRIELQGLLAKDLPRDLRIRVRYQLAYTHYIEGDTEGAIEGFDRLIDDFPDDPLAVDALMGKAKALEEGDRLTEALEVLDELLDVYPNREVVETRIEWVNKRLREGPGPRKEAR